MWLDGYVWQTFRGLADEDLTIDLQSGISQCQIFSSTVFQCSWHDSKPILRQPLSCISILIYRTRHSFEKLSRKKIIHSFENSSQCVVMNSLYTYSDCGTCIGPTSSRLRAWKTRRGITHLRGRLLKSFLRSGTCRLKASSFDHECRCLVPNSPRDSLRDHQGLAHTIGFLIGITRSWYMGTCHISIRNMANEARLKSLEC